MSPCPPTDKEVPPGAGCNPVSRIALREITGCERVQAYREMVLSILHILNEQEDFKDSLSRVAEEVQRRTGFGAVGIRLQDGADFPYFVQFGFPEDFLLTENSVVECNADGLACCDKDGNVRLECTCGLVLSGKTDPANPLFTQGGSFWTNDAVPLLDLPPDQDPRLNPRNQCMHYGYASMALVPIRSRERIVGLLHLNDRRKGCFDLDTVQLLEECAANLGRALIRKRAESELLKADKLQSVGTLAGGIAHDFNNLLLGLFGNVSLAKENLPKEHPSYAFLEEAEASMNRAVRLTRQLLTFSKGGAPVKTTVDLGALAKEIAQQDLAGSALPLVFRKAADLWPVEGDEDQLRQVFSNLILNARQAMPHGGHLYITLENADLRENSIDGLCHGRYVKVSIRDEGAGIDPKVFDKIFAPYFTTKQAGRGLGLATVWSIITKHGGHIGVVSKLGKGSTFTFHLPSVETLRQADSKTTVESLKTAPQPARILFLDDDDSICKLASRMLTRCGHSVETVPGGQEAIALYKQSLDAGVRFDVVIMDLTIPGGIGGKEVINELLVLDPHVRAIASSGYADDPVMADYAAYGFKGAVAKPYTQNDLREIIARVLS